MICACTETSSAETGSSAMISLGSQRERPGDADALALAAGELVRDSGRRARRAGRPGRAAPAPARSTSRPLAMPCSSIGSPMIWPTRLRGFSDAYGSWKIICIWRRIGRSCARDRPTSSSPSNRTEPDVGVVSCRIARHSVDFPQPDSPTRPSVSPSSRVRLTPSTARTRADLAVDQDARLDREVLDEVGRPRAAVSPFTVATGFAGRSGRRPRGGALLIRRPSQQRSRVRAAAAPSHLSNACGQRGGEPAAGRRAEQRRRLARDLGQAFGTRLCRAGPATPAAPRCRGAGGRRTSRRACAVLDDLAGVHHRDPVGDLGDDAEVVGDQHDRQAPFPVQIGRAAAGSAPGR